MRFLYSVHDQGELLALHPQGEANLTKTTFSEGPSSLGVENKDACLSSPTRLLFLPIPLFFISTFAPIFNIGFLVFLYLPPEFEIKSACRTRSTQPPHALMYVANQITVASKWSACLLRIGHRIFLCWKKTFQSEANVMPKDQNDFTSQKAAFLSSHASYRLFDVLVSNAQLTAFLCFQGQPIWAKFLHVTDCISSQRDLLQIQQGPFTKMDILYSLCQTRKTHPVFLMNQHTHFSKCPRR